MGHYMEFIEAIKCAFTESLLGIFSLFILLIGIVLLFLGLVKPPIKIFDNEFPLPISEYQQAQIRPISYKVLCFGFGLALAIIVNYPIYVNSPPPGSYIETCENISFFNKKGKLKADCLNRNGSYTNTSLEIPKCFQGKVTNCGGNLKRGSCF